MTNTINVDIDIDIDEIIDEISTETLIDELKCRDVDLSEFNSINKIIFENLYYALRDKDLDKAIEIINPLLDKTIGRMV